VESSSRDQIEALFVTKTYSEGIQEFQFRRNDVPQLGTNQKPNKTKRREEKTRKEKKRKEKKRKEKRREHARK
jgi:Spy/CpxP family protein refolding chaperone